MKTKRAHKAKKSKRAQRKRPKKHAIKKVQYPRELKPILKRYGNNLPSLISSIKKMEALEARTNKTYADLLRDYEAKAEQLSKAEETLEATEKKRNNLSKENSHLERYCSRVMIN